MMNVSYERISHLLAVAKGIDPESTINDTEILYVQFSSYVKSQIHLNFVSGFFDRNIYSYKRVYDYLYGRIARPDKDLCDIIKYFYCDMANFCINYNKPLKLLVDVDVSVNMPTYELHYEAELDRFKRFYFKVCDSFDAALSTVKFYKDYMQFFDKVSCRLSEEEAKDFIGNYMLAAILLQNSDKKIKII